MKKHLRIAVLHNAERAGGRGIITGIAQRATEIGTITIYYPPPSYARGYRYPLTEWVGKISPDGFILAASCPELARILKTRKPVVVHRNHSIKIPPEIPLMLGNGRQMGQMAAEYLMGLGLDNFGYFGLRPFVHSDERREGFLAALAEKGRGAAVYESPLRGGKATWGATKGGLLAWLRKLPKPVGIMAICDDMARTLLDTCRAAELHVPDQVAVLGVDNDLILCETANPPLSSIALNHEQMSQAALDLLVALIQRREKINGQRLYILPTHIVERASTDIVACPDGEVGRALQFIRDHVCENIRVSDVAAEVVAAPSKLQKKFHRLLGCTVHDRIAAERIKRISKMLLETGNSITRIAAQAGFQETTKMSRFFRAKTGMTPVQFRRKHGK